jgi:20S proteasome alpha/beta subunit
MDGEDEEIMRINYSDEENYPGDNYVDSSSPRWENRATEEVAPVTVCIAAVCKHEGKSAIVLCCDWQGTKGDFIKSDSIDKFRWISTGSALIAGDETSADELLTECDQCIREYVEKDDPTRTDLDVQLYFDSLREAVARRKKKLVKEHVVLSLGLGIEEFWKNGRAYLGDAEHSKMLGEIRELPLGCSLIIASINADGDDTIVRILQSGRVLWENQFVTTGSGGAIAEAFLNQYDWDEDISLEECLYRVFLAKLAAEKSPHVGPTTSFEILIGRQRFDLSDAAWKHLKQRAASIRKVPRLTFPVGFLG